MRWKYLLGGMALLPIVGCANLMSISRETEINSTFGTKFPAKAIHLDAEQRLVFSDTRALCAEPSPDALTALASSLGAGLTYGGNAGSVAQAFNETAASIGLRTQSITLMRDTLYRMCEAYHNFALDERDYVQLLQRSQDLTLGVLAIEQLTGVAMANQAALGGEANANAASALRTTQDMLNKAVADETTASNAKIEAEGKRDATKKKIEELGPESEDTEEEKAQRKALSTELGEQEKDVKTKNEALVRAEQTKKQIESNRDAAFAEARAAARGTASLSSPATAGATLTDSSTQHIAGAVERIVANVVGKNHVVDNCVNFLTKPERKSDDRENEKLPEVELAEARANENSRKATADLCRQAMTADVAMRQNSNAAQSEAYEHYFRGPLPKPKPGTELPSPDKLTPPPNGVY